MELSLASILRVGLLPAAVAATFAVCGEQPFWPGVVFLSLAGAASEVILWWIEGPAAHGMRRLVADVLGFAAATFAMMFLYNQDVGQVIQAYWFCIGHFAISGIMVPIHRWISHAAGRRLPA